MPVNRALVHHREGGFDESPKLDSISDLLQGGTDCIIWLDIQDPTDEDVELLRTEFGFHELALEDVVSRHQRPKIDQYDGYGFIVFYALGRDRLDEINMFVGKHYLVTLHQGTVSEIDATVERWHLNADRIGHDVAVPVYSLFVTINSVKTIHSLDFG